MFSRCDGGFGFDGGGSTTFGAFRGFATPQAFRASRFGAVMSSTTRFDMLRVAASRMLRTERPLPLSRGAWQPSSATARLRCDELCSSPDELSEARLRLYG